MQSIVRSHICGISCHPGDANCTGYCQNKAPTPASYEVRLFDFGEALRQLKAGEKVSRLGWNGKGMWLFMQRPDVHSKMTLPYIYIEYPEGHPAYPMGSRVPWLPSQTDMLGEDWMVFSA